MSRVFESGGSANIVPATATTLGGVKSGGGVTVAPDGTLSVTVADLSGVSSWDALTTYGLAGPQVVSYSGSTYVSAAPSGPGATGGVQPPDPGVSTFWKLVAVEGDQGLAGPSNDDALILTFFLMGAA